MKQRPILFSASMVRALLNGSKTQTRRVCKPQPIADSKFSGGHYIPATKRTLGAQISVEALYVGVACPHGQVGDQLWVRETWRTDASLDKKAPSQFSGWAVKYQADGRVIKHGSFFGDLAGKTRVSIHMPRWASRITLEITGVRLERLQDISRGDCMAEGCPFPNIAKETDPKQWYRDLWESLNGAGSWDLNPYVWVIEFKKVKP